MTTTHFIEPLDVLFLRGNQLFGEPGSYGEGLMPPWPSVAAGALRSRILVDDGVDLTAFANGAQTHPTLGTPTEPGSFALQAFHLARRDGQTVEAVFHLPADLVVTDDGQVQRIHPTQVHPALATSFPLPLLPVLAQDQRRKAASGWWLRQGGWQKYLHGQPVTKSDLVPTAALWGYDERVGVGLDSATRSAAEGKLFTARAIAMQPSVGFVVAVAGASVPNDGLLRLGGDGRGAALHAAQLDWPEADLDAIARAGRCRIVLTSLGIFSDGWQLPGMDGNQHITLPGLRARVVSAAVSRAETISGWNLAARTPKAAQKAAGTGSVYWLDDLQISPDAMRKLAAQGLWTDPGEDAQRRAEGFNRFSFAAY